jgi:hypothetical protein
MQFDSWPPEALDQRFLIKALFVAIAADQAMTTPPVGAQPAIITK